MDAATHRAVVVVVGLGYGGLVLAHALDGAAGAGTAYEVVGIDARKAFWHTWGVPRALVNEAYARRFVVPYDQLIKHGRVLTEARVVDVTMDDVVIDNGDRIHYDYLVLATGSVYQGFVKADIGIEASLAHMKAVHDVAAKPQSRIVIIGAGLSGVEFAGEIKSAFTHCQVTLVDANATILMSTAYPADEITDNFRNDLIQKLQALGVELLFNERVILPDDGFGIVQPLVVKTESGREIESDAQICTIGSSKPSTDFLSKSKLASAIDQATGKLRVNEFLQVQGFTNVFALGDVCTTKELQALFEAGYLGTALAQRITQPHAVKPYKPFPAHLMATVSLSPTIGSVVGFPFKGWGVLGWFGNVLARTLKGNDVMLGSFAAALNVKLVAE